MDGMRSARGTTLTKLAGVAPPAVHLGLRCYGKDGQDVADHLHAGAQGVPWQIRDPRVLDLAPALTARCSATLRARVPASVRSRPLYTWSTSPLTCAIAAPTAFAQLQLART